MPRRLLTFLGTLPLLLLSSCEPGEEGANTDKGNNGRDTKAQAQKILRNVANKERLAAQDSIGRLPQPQNMLEGIEDECPVHHEKMKVREIPIVFTDAASGKSETSRMPVTARFPFGAEKIVSAGNALLPGQPLTALVYQCASCVAARKAAEETQSQAGTAK